MIKGMVFDIILEVFNLHTEHIMRNAELDELQAEIKMGRRNSKTLDIQMVLR